MGERRVSDLASRLVLAFERADTGSAAVMRRTTYRLLDEFGIDVTRLMDEARAAIRAERSQDLERSQGTDAKLAAWVARIPELSAHVQGGPIARARELLGEKKVVNGNVVRKYTLAEIATALECKRSFVAAVRDLDIARRAKARLEGTHKGKTKKLVAKLAKFLDRTPWSSAPTKERRGHLGQGEEFAKTKTVGEQQHHSTRWAVDQIRDILTGPEYEAACRFRDANNGRKLERQGNPGAPTDKLGQTPEQEYWGRVWAGLWPKVPAGARRIVQNFVLEKAWTGEERTQSFVEFGMAYGRIDGEKQARGIAQGALKLACTVLAHISKEYDGLVKAEKLRAYRELQRHRDVVAYIADCRLVLSPADEVHNATNEATAVGLMCKRCPAIQPWALRYTVRNAIKAVIAEREKRAREKELAA